MKKLLLSFLLFAGCDDDDFGGICVVEHTFSNTWSCYEDKSEHKCLYDLDGEWIGDGDNDSDWFSGDQECDHFCGEGDWDIPGVEGHDCE